MMKTILGDSKEYAGEIKGECFQYIDKTRAVRKSVNILGLKTFPISIEIVAGGKHDVFEVSKVVLGLRIPF